MCNKNTHNFNMHFMLSVLTFWKTETMLENVLQTLSVEEYVLFEYQDHQRQFLSLIGCVQGTGFGNKSYTKWKQIMLTVANALYKNRGVLP